MADDRGYMRHGYSLGFGGCYDAVTTSGRGKRLNNNVIGDRKFFSHGATR